MANFQGQAIKVVSFNVKRDMAFNIHKENRWERRRQLVSDVIRASGASIIGVQELLPEMKLDVQRLLSQEYSVFGNGRFFGVRPEDDEHSDIIVKNDDAQVRFCKTFWLSKDPEKNGSRAYFSVFPRICTVVEVTLKDTGRRIRVFNTHFDHICSFARNLGAQIILKYMDAYNQREPLPTILMGDLNARPGSRAVKILKENLHDYSTVHLNDVYSFFDPDAIYNTFHNFSGKQKHGRGPIDYIFVSDDFEVVESHIWAEDRDGRYPSDHYPLVATLRLKDPRPLSQEQEQEVLGEFPRPVFSHN